MAAPRPAPMSAPRAMVSSGDDFAVRPFVRRNTPAEAAAVIEQAMLQDEPDVRFAPAVGSGAEALVEVPVSFARAAEQVLMRPEPVTFASGAEDMRFERPDPMFAPAAQDIMMEPAPRARLAPAAMDILMEPARDPRSVLGQSTSSYPLDVRPNTEAELRDLMNAKALEEAASRAFNAPPPPPPPTTMERASLADSLLRALGLR